MTIITKGGKTYNFIVDSKTGHLRVKFGSNEIIVTDIEHIVIGGNMIIKGYSLDNQPIPTTKKCGKILFSTTAIEKIIP